MYTAIMYAKSLECVELLLDIGADINAFDCTGAKVIQHHRNPRILDRLVAAGGVLESPSDASNSMIQTAAQEGNLQLVDYLLQYGIDVNAPNPLQVTPLMEAAERGHVDVLRRLIAVGADLHAREYRGRTALFYAAAPETGIAFQVYQNAEMFRPQIMDEILSQLPPGVREMMGNTPAPILPMGYHPSDDVMAIDLLVQAGAEVDTRDAEGATPLLVACGCGRVSRVARLLTLGADFKARDTSDRSALDMLTLHHDVEQREQIRSLLANV
jgi:ankyrin repeat protein